MKPEFYHNIRRLYGQHVWLSNDQVEWTRGVLVKAHLEGTITFESSKGARYDYMKL
jgi:hypothetical protein